MLFKELLHSSWLIPRVIWAAHPHWFTPTCPEADLSSLPVFGLGCKPGSSVAPFTWKLTGAALPGDDSACSQNHLPQGWFEPRARTWLLLLTQRLSGAASPVADWRCFPGSGLWPQWTWKEQGGGAQDRPLCNWWIKGTDLVQMDSRGPAAHRGPGMKAGQLWMLWPRSGAHPPQIIGREKSKAWHPSSCGIQEDQQNSLNVFKVSRRWNSQLGEICRLMLYLSKGSHISSLFVGTLNPVEYSPTVLIHFAYPLPLITRKNKWELQTSVYTMEERTHQKRNHQK